MSRYLLRFRVETALTRNEDLPVQFAGLTPVFLFSEKKETDGYVIARIDLEATTNIEAWNTCASTLLPPILDALSFATGTPLLLRDCELVLKDETGSTSRRALYIGHRHATSSVPLSPDQVKDVQTILEDGEALRLPLCWHRYALDRELVHEQFVFNWLAFEALAGDTDVSTRCPHCRNEVEHCGKIITHRSSSKESAQTIFQAAHASTSDREFKKDIWGSARNRVFHGREYPRPEYLQELANVSRKLHAAVDLQIERLLFNDECYRPHFGYETWFRHFLLIQWTTTAPTEAFAGDCPVAYMANMSAEEQPGEAYSDAQAAGIQILNYERDSQGW
jgi:hypothetical protein